MDHLLAARIALSSLCVIQAVATAVIDFNRTHATNPLWQGHARFHVVWQTNTVVLLAVLELGLVWRSGSSADGRFYLAAMLAALSPLGFLATLVSRRWFGGTLYDPNGIPPARVRSFGAVRSIDMNLVAVILALAALVAIIAIYRS